MHVVPSPQDRSQCPVCRAALRADSLFCASCGARPDETLAEELRNVVYLLSELKNWEAQELIGVDEAEALRSRYELRREELRAHLSSNGEQPKNFASTASAVTPIENPPVVNLPPSSTPAVAKHSPRAASGRETRRPLFETLAEPYTLRLLLYTGAAMLVVGIIIWLRDVLYLKLQEPLVQAALLALGTLAVTISGWLMTLRTRMRLTGRALTLIGSVLVPVNFWFLVRSNLISEGGRAWVVCALCAALYAHTAALLRERLYVYLACAAGIATAWTLVYRASPEAYGLYALTLSTASLVFLHLSRAFPPSPVQEKKEEAAKSSAAQAKANDEIAKADDAAAKVNSETAKVDDGATKAFEPSRWSYELWGTPLVRVALLGATVAALLYMLLRLGLSRSFDESAFGWRVNEYDAAIAMLLFVAGAYVAWFTARYIHTQRRALLYTTSALALFWTEFLLLDGLRVRGETHLLALSATALTLAFVVRFMPDKIPAEALHRASAILFTLLFIVSSIVALLFHLAANELDASWRPSMFFALPAIVLFGSLRGWHKTAGRSIYGAGLASMAALVFVAAALDALQAISFLPSQLPIAAGVICAAFVLQRISLRLLRTEDAETKEQRVRVIGTTSLDALIRLVMDGGVLVCALLWFARMITAADVHEWSVVAVLLLALLYWIERAARLGLASYAHLASLHAGAFLLSLLFALRFERRWIAASFTLILFPALFALSRYASERGALWLKKPAGQAAAILTALISLVVVLQAVPVLQAGNDALLAPAITASALCIVTLPASFFSTGRERVGYFRVSLFAAVSAFALTVLRAGYDPLTDVEMYTSPVAVVLLIVSYLAARREWDEYARDTNLLLWTGSLLLCGPLLIRALQFRLLLDLPAPWRDMSVLGVSLALILLGAMGRLRAPVIMGTITLLLELAALTLTSVEWLQVPLKVYLITAGALIMIIWGVFEYRREQLLLVRKRLHERGAQARERFGEWR
jgi:hypothetical protein